MIRDLSAVVGFFAFLLMVYRLVSTWDETDWLTRALAGGVMALLFVGAIGSAVYSLNDIPGIDWVQWLILGARIVGLIVAIVWPCLVGQRGIPFTPSWRRHP